MTTQSHSALGAETAAPESVLPEIITPTKIGTTFHTEQVLTVAGGHFVHDSYSAFLPPLLPLIQERLSGSIALAGSLVIFTQMPSLLNPFIGYLADRVSVRYFVILAPGVTGTLMSLMGFATNYFYLAMLLLAAGISAAAFHAPAPAMIGRISGNRIGTGMSIFMATGELGRTVGPVLVAAGVTWWGLDGIWRLAGIGWLVSLILYWRLHTISARPAAQKSMKLTEIRGDLLRVFAALGSMMLPQMFMIVAITTYLPTFMSNVLGSDLWVAAISLTVLEGAGVVGALLTGTLSDRFGRRYMLLVLLTIAPLLLLAFLYAPPVFALPLLVGLGLTGISQTPVRMAIVQDNFPNHRAVANGIFMAMNFVIRAIAVGVVGLLSDRFGMMSAFYWSGIAAFISIPTVLWLPERKRA